MKKVICLVLLFTLPGCTNWFKGVETDPPELTHSRLKLLDEKLAEYKAIVGEYPADLPELIAGPSVPELQGSWKGPLVKEADLKDGWDKPFVYKREDGEPPYVLYSKGEPQKTPEEA